MDSISRRSALVGLSAFLTKPAWPQSGWPGNPLTLVHGFPPGGPVDTLSRVLSEALSKRLGQAVVVDARPGATGMAAAARVARAAPDGYTLLAVPATYAATVAMHRELGFRPLDDFSFIGTTAEYPLVIATHAEHPAHTFADFIRAARASREPLTYGTAGTGSLQHLTMVLFELKASLRLQHVPYRGGAPAITDLLGRRLDLVIDPPTALLQHVREGRLRALAVTTSTRFARLRDTPTVAEEGYPSLVVSAYQGLAAPAGLPAHLTARLNGELTAVLRDPAIVDRLATFGNEAKPSTSDGYRAQLAADIARWRALVRDAQIERI